MFIVGCVFTVGLGKPNVYQLFASNDEKDWSSRSEEEIVSSYIEMSHEKSSPVSA